MTNFASLLAPASTGELVSAVANRHRLFVRAGDRRRFDQLLPLRSLPPGSDPHTQDLDALGRVYVPGQAGDLVIWHQALPHGASRNTSRMPQLVQYLTYLPLA